MSIYKNSKRHGEDLNLWCFRTSAFKADALSLTRATMANEMRIERFELSALGLEPSILAN